MKVNIILKITVLNYLKILYQKLICLGLYFVYFWGLIYLYTNNLCMYVYKYNQICIFKRYFIIDKKIERHFVHYSECLPQPPSLVCNSNIHHFLNSRISANHYKGLGFQLIMKPLYSLMFQQCRISFVISFSYKYEWYN